MINRTVYLYRAFPEKIANFSGPNGVYMRFGSNLIAIDINTVADLASRNKIVEDFSLREFEIEQEKFLDVIQLLPSLGAYLTEVRISPRYADEYQSQLAESISQQNIPDICSIIKGCWNTGANIESIEFFWNGNRIRFSRLAELDLSADNPDIGKILNDKPVGILAGVLRGGD